MYARDLTNRTREIWPDEADRMAVNGAVGAMLGGFSLSLTPEDMYETPGVPSMLAGFSFLSGT